jgi:hypothetical protein
MQLSKNNKFTMMELTSDQGTHPNRSENSTARDAVTF